MSNKGLPITINVLGVPMRFKGFGTFPPQYAATQQLNPRAAVYESEDGTAWTHSDARDFKNRDTKYDTYPSDGGIDSGYYYQTNVDAKGGITVVELRNGQPMRIVFTCEIEDRTEAIAATKAVCDCLNERMYSNRTIV